MKKMQITQTNNEKKTYNIKILKTKTYKKIKKY